MHTVTESAGKMEEQVVPGLAPCTGGARFVRSVPVKAAKAAKVPNVVGGSFGSTVHDHAVPALRSAKRPKLESNVASPAAEYAGKMRWTTPLRTGRWLERWESARELGLHVAVRAREQSGVATVVRTAIAEAVVANVGDLLPLATVQKWLCLLCEYLELNADEQVLVVCLLRKYVSVGGRFVGEGDWARPQRWECVVAISCYFAVLLTEEFPGRTSMDLRELLGPNFRFGNEQVAFLKLVDWRISISDTVFSEVKECCVNVANNVPGEKARLMEWFRLDVAVADRKKRAAVADAAAKAASVAAAAAAAKAAKAATAAALAVKPGLSYYNAPPNMKKRSFAAIAPANDSMVPVAFVPQFSAQVPQPFVAPGVIPSVPQWLPHGW